MSKLESERAQKTSREDFQQDSVPFRDFSQGLYGKGGEEEMSVLSRGARPDDKGPSQLVFSDLWSEIDNKSARHSADHKKADADGRYSRDLAQRSTELAPFVKREARGELDTFVRPDGKPGLGKLGASLDQISRAVKRFDPEIWERNSSSKNVNEQVTNIRNLQVELKTGGLSAPALEEMNHGRLPSKESLENFEKQFPDDFMEKVNSFLVGEAANEIMKQSISQGNSDKFEREPDRLLKESLLSVKLGHVPNDAEYKANAAALDKQIHELRRNLSPGLEWTPDRQKLLSEIVHKQIGKSEHWNSDFAKATNNGRLACAGFITNGAAAHDARLEGMIPSLDLNMNGVVGEALLRGFQAKTIETTLQEAQSRGGHSMAFVIRPAKVGSDFSMLGGGNGHIGFLSASTGEVIHNSSKSGVGIKENVITSDSFDAARRPFVLVPPGWEKHK